MGMARNKPSRSLSSKRNGRIKNMNWLNFDDRHLLQLRICELGLQLKGSRLEGPIEQLNAELEQRNLRFRPHTWLSSEWFSPDGVPGIGIPFFLAHPRLMRLEKKQMLEVEGGSHTWCMQILRHEAGHAIDTAFRLHRKKRWRELFGKYTTPYPDHYRPKPFSRDYVLHLHWWYSQAHPAEDFAETFAVWLNPNSRWRQRYQGWRALRKLEYVDEIMQQIAGQPAPVKNRILIDPVGDLPMTLGGYYRQKRLRYLETWPDFYDHDLRRLFSDAKEYSRQPTAASFLRTIRSELRTVVADWTGEYQYTIDQVVLDMIDRCRELSLRLTRPKEEVRLEAIVMVTMQTMNYMFSANHRIAL